jgi:hypothetical protein
MDPIISIVRGSGELLQPLTSVALIPQISPLKYPLDCEGPAILGFLRVPLFSKFPHGVYT